MLRCLAALLLVAGLTPPAWGELVRLEITRREPLAGSQAFGTVGPYEKLVGIAHFAVDPKHPLNRMVVDLDRAPRNAAGKVEYSADVYILTPADPTKGNGAILYDVNNRGNKLALRMFNDAVGSADPSKPEHAGQGYLMRRGYTVVWCGWNGEILPGEGRMLLAAPQLKNVHGPVTYEMSSDTPTDNVPLARREGHGSYAPTEAGEREGVLTRRPTAEAKPTIVPRSDWSLERKPVPSSEGGVPGTLAQIRLKLKGGFVPGELYTLTCECEGPIVQGLGFCAVRDLISHLKHDKHGLPVAVNRAHGFGVSQSGRFLRHFLYEGFNADEKGRIVFEGLIPHVAGGGMGVFNDRFVQPTRSNFQHEDHLYPCDVFPFTYGDSADHWLSPEGQVRGSGRKDGLLRRAQAAKTVPKVMHTQSCAEYWTRAGSLPHTDTLGRQDAEIPPEVRIYAFGGTQHGPASAPPPRGIAEHLNNPADYRPLLRGLLDTLDAWVKDGTEPPASVYPRIDNGTLVAPTAKTAEFPNWSKVPFPTVIQRPPARDWFGNLNPAVGHYVVLVPKSGPDGNDLGTLLVPDVAVPLATYTGWNLRRQDVGAGGELASMLGSYLPFARTAQEREATGDPRPSLLERYGNADRYRQQYEAACARLVKDRYLLAEDAERLIAGRQAAVKVFGETP